MATPSIVQFQLKNPFVPTPIYAITLATSLPYVTLTFDMFMIN